ncbi:hypothetical protein ACIBCT_35290 [Streptosporangium sp. NPDC050855]|uniref:hypothetical protein n=1 Tax=Streptosporangium sp. NPDC050855 TaxID=3366194 RepID=UPI0037B4BC27
MDAELVSMLASPKKGIALKFGDQISNGAHVLAYTGIHSSTRITRAVALCWCPTRKEFVIWTIEYGYADQGEAWYAHNGHRAGQDLAYALLSYTQQAGPGASLPNFIY